MPMKRLTTLLQKLKIPSEYARYEKIDDQGVIARLDGWRNATLLNLIEIRTLIDSTPSLSLEEQAGIVSAVASFDGHDPWVNLDMQSAAKDILGHFVNAQQALLVQILSEHIKPCFLANPHPQLNAAGRKLTRPAGGPMASQDFYDSQTWKSFLGVVNILSWCVRHIPAESYEQHWHLLIPPVMTLLDDYETRYKLRGVGIVSEILQHIPGQLLKRTGVDGLIRSSLKNCLTHLNSFETSQLIQAAVPALLSLTLLTTSIGSAEQFDQLCDLLGDGIISGIWFYAYDKPEVILASLHALPLVLRALKTGNARFLKALMTQFVHALEVDSVNRAPVKMQTISLELLRIVIKECPVSIPRWKGTILGGIARCWVTVKESERDDPEIDHLRTELRHTCDALERCCPSVIEDEYKKLLETDEAMFRSMLNVGKE